MNDNSPRPDVAIYIASFDGYSDLWDPFFKSFFTFWPDCPYPVYLGANQKSYDDARVISLKAGEHNNWSSRAFEHLEQIKEPYVLMLLEDYFLKSKVDTDTVKTIRHYMETLDLHAVRLFPCPKPQTAVNGYPLIGFQGVGQQNRTSTQATLWRKSSLLELMRQGESLWEFELNSSVRSNRFNGGICGTWTTVLNYHLGIERGKWIRSAYWGLKRHNIAVDLAARPLHSWAYEVGRLQHIYIDPIIRMCVPLRARQRILSLLFPNYYKQRRQ